MPQDAVETAGAGSADVLTITDAVVYDLPRHAFIVVRVPNDQAEQDVFASLATRLHMLGRNDVTVCAVQPDGDLTVLDEDQMREQGWVRA